MGKGKTELAIFYCINCGKKGLPIQRKVSKQKERMHHKKLYCPWCRETHNAVEIKTFEEKEEFLRDFENGKFIDEVNSNPERGGN